MKLDTVENIKTFVSKSGATFGFTTFSAHDVDKPLHIGDGNIIFPTGWSDQQCTEYRRANDLEAPRE